MAIERASRAISLVLISSVLVFAGWSCGDYLRHSERSRAAGTPYAGYHGYGSRFFWFHSYGPPYYYGGTGGGSVTRGGTTTGSRSSTSGPSLRGGFGSSGHAAGA